MRQASPVLESGIMILHFGGSKPGIVKNMSDYQEIRSVILNSGHKLGRDWLGEQKSKGLLNIFSENEKSISKSDAVILDATFDTHGIGIQLGLALMYKRPTLLLIKNGASDPITGLKFIDARDQKLLHFEEYEGASDIKKVLDPFIEWIEHNTQLARFNIELDRKLDNYLRLKSKINNTSKAEEIRRLVEEDLERHES